MKICIWCKYGNEIADEKFRTTFKVLRDANKCPKCDRESVSSTFMEEE